MVRMFGLDEEILPSLTHQGFGYIKKRGKNIFKVLGKCFVLFHFAFNMKILWIFCWNFNIIPDQSFEYNVKRIIRRSKIKWWIKFREINCCPKAVN